MLEITLQTTSGSKRRYNEDSGQKEYKRGGREEKGVIAKNR